MKILENILKVVAALAAIAAALYVAITYGDKIRAWLKKHLGCCGCCEPEAMEAPEEAFEPEAPATEEAPVAEEAPAAEEPAVEESPVAEETPAEEPAAEGEVIADETDFVEGE